MRAIIKILFAALLFCGCQNAAPTSETELRITQPTIVQAKIVNADGYSLSHYSLPASPNAPAESAFVRALVTGFTPVKEMWLRLPDGREFPFERLSYKRFQINLAKLLTPDVVARKGEGPVRLKVVAVDIDNDRTVSDDLRLNIAVSTH